jgi:two-component system, OmpR family, response regulator
MSSRPPLRVVASGHGEVAAPARTPLRILIADDDRDTCLSLAAILRDEGHEAHTVLRGDEVLGVERLTRPDALIIDINMPGMSGYAVAREIRVRRSGSRAPLLIAISGVWTKSSEQLLGRAVGFDHYLLKPCEPAQVVAILAALAISLSSAERAASVDRRE